MPEHPLEQISRRWTIARSQFCFAWIRRLCPAILTVLLVRIEGRTTGLYTSNDCRDVTKTRTRMRTRARVRARVRHGSLNVDLLPRQTDRRYKSYTLEIVVQIRLHLSCSLLASAYIIQRGILRLSLSLRSILPRVRFVYFILLVWHGRFRRRARVENLDSKSRESLACLHRSSDVGNVFHVGSFQDHGSRYDHAHTGRPTYVFYDGIHGTLVWRVINARARYQT